jgi:hypothetical protein
MLKYQVHAMGGSIGEFESRQAAMIYAQDMRTSMGIPFDAMSIKMVDHNNVTKERVARVSSRVTPYRRGY